jgi:hypothetical protein
MCKGVRAYFLLLWDLNASYIRSHRNLNLASAGERQDAAQQHKGPHNSFRG